MGILLALAWFGLISGGLALALWGGLLGWFFAGGVVGSALGERARAVRLPGRDEKRARGAGGGPYARCGQGS